mgnify:CR=1 FL=1
MVLYRSLLLGDVNARALTGEEARVVKFRNELVSLVNLGDRAAQRMMSTMWAHGFLLDDHVCSLPGYDEIHGAMMPAQEVDGLSAFHRCVYGLMRDLDDRLEKEPSNVDLTKLRRFLREDMGLDEVVSIGRRLEALADEQAMIVESALRAAEGEVAPRMTDVALQRLMNKAIFFNHQDGLEAFVNFVIYPNVRIPSQTWDQSPVRYHEGSPDEKLCQLMETADYYHEVYDSGSEARAAIPDKHISFLANGFDIDPHLSHVEKVEAIQRCRVQDQETRMNQALATQWQRARSDFDQELADKERKLTDEHYAAEDQLRADVAHWRELHYSDVERIGVLEAQLASLETQHQLEVSRLEREVARLIGRKEQLKAERRALRHALDDDDMTLFSASSVEEEDEPITMEVVVEVESD